ncbi:DEAD/DEAH box helicase [Eggerthella sp. YY7918]|uniref:DEAD/DEAH box helicase n=1 Tax=Eggerthella sp. (strain YY7918) TaxID=502558 RepID=UPI00021714CB|nr:DEAD/DEAH box helicase [Eggerthella sp. YY7918]BAK44345.1 superfamily II DNA helicase [Eggerthella sp. YY7918]
MLQFNELGLSEHVLQAVARLGYEAPTPVQEQAIPLALEGRDLIAAAKTGTGKTAAFSLPSLDRVGHAKGGQGPLMLVVTPTRELAQQIGEVCSAIAVSTHHRILTVVGGLSYEPQISKLKHGVDILIATPGRLVDLMEQGAVRLGDVEVLVLDEADRMLDMGFWPAMKKIIGATPSTRQTLLFSATIDASIKNSVGKLLHNPAFVEIAHKGETADTVEQYIIHTQQNLKPDLLKALLAEKGSERVIVFARTRSRADSTCRRLKRAGFTAEAIHSDRSQNQRRRALDNFASGRVGVIVATDVLARGIDVEEVDYVVNYDLPTQPEDYVHRIGRTGRAGAAGFAVSFVSPETNDALRDIEKLIKRPIPEMELASYDAETAAAEAAARTARAETRRDPEIKQAAKEMAARERKKAKAREAAQTDAAASTPTHSAANKKRRTPKKPVGVAGAQPNRQRPSQQQAKKQSSATQGKKPPVSSAPAKRGGADLRPGRARRASLAQQRTKRR